MVRKRGLPDLQGMLRGVDEVLDPFKIGPEETGVDQEKNKEERQEQNLEPAEQEKVLAPGKKEDGRPEPVNDSKDTNEVEEAESTDIPNENMVETVTETKIGPQSDTKDYVDDVQIDKSLDEFIRNYTDNFLNEKLMELLLPKKHRQKISYKETHIRRSFYLRSDNIKRMDKFNKATGFDGSATINMALDILFFLAEKDLDLFKLKMTTKGKK